MAESVFDKPIDNAIKELNSKLTEFVFETRTVTFDGTCDANTDLTYTLNDTSKSGYRICSIFPQLNSANANLFFRAETFGSNDEQVIVMCGMRKGVSGSHQNPQCILKLMYRKI